MPPWLPSVTYPPSQNGYWGPVTSTLNWCEEDYYATIYSAEIVNTLTNLLFIYLAARGIISCVKHGHDQIFLISFLGYMLVGTGSFLFHTTLKYPMQLVDELSMIYSTCLMSYAAFSFSKPNTFRVFLAIGLVGLAVFITLYYHYLQDPAFHQNAYALLTIIVLTRSMYVMEVNLRPSLTKRQETYKLERKVSMTPSEKLVTATEDARDRRILRSMWWMIASGIGIFLAGFGVWTLDNVYCSTLRRWRHEIGLPWGILLEGHGWWHLMTGVGAYLWLTWGIWLRHCLNGRQDEFEFYWPRLFSFPEIIRQRPGTNGAINGTVKGTANGSIKDVMQKRD